MWQEIIVGIIGMGIVVYIAYKVYRSFAKPESQGCGCGCSGCTAKKKTRLKKIDERK